MTENISDQLSDRVVTQALRLNSFDADVRRRVRRLLREVEADVIAQLLLKDPTLPRRPTFRERRLIALLSQVEASLRHGYRKVQAAVNDDLRGVAELEGQFARQSINRLVGADILSVELTPQFARSLVSDLMIRGAPSRDWWAGQRQLTQRRFQQQVRLGMAQGEGIDSIVRRIRGTRAGGFEDGIMAISRREAAALARTSVQTISSDVRMETFRANDDVVDGSSWLSTLDSKTTAICIALSGASWRLDGTPYPDSPFQGTDPGGPPAHWQCRSARVARLKSMEDILGGAVSGRRARALDRAIPASTQASMDGQVAGDLKFSDWLKTKEVSGPAFANGVLGKTRAELWRQGKLPLHRLIDQTANPLTLKGLRREVGRVTGKAIREARAA